MNIQMSIERISDPIKKLILKEPTIKRRYEQGESLEGILCCPHWAAEWLQTADIAQIEVLTRILHRFAGLPFELESLMKIEAQTHILTGADIRVAVARLRRSGILFAIRKAWGDQLIYLPTDAVIMWQPLLLAVDPIALPESAMREIARIGKGFCPPLSIELLLAWHTIYRQPITFTTKGFLHRPSITHLSSKMHLKQQELECLALTYPETEQIPVQVALALDIGLYYGILHEDGNALQISNSDLDRWLALSPSEADIRLYELIMTRYGSGDPALHLIASAVNSLPAGKWYVEQSIRVFGEQKNKIEQWLGLMESFGWVERGLYNGQPVFCKNDRLDPQLQFAYIERQPLIVQPDGEIFVPPETGLEQRWMLEEIADRITEDHLFVYRLTREACIRAFNAGHTLQSIVAFLERNVSTSLPEPCLRALMDWFTPLGKVKFTEVLLLRTESSEIAAILKGDPQISEHLVEQVGDKNFIIAASSSKLLQARLLKIGFPPLQQSQKESNSLKSVKSNKTVSTIAAAVSQEKEKGLIKRKHVLSIYEADRTIPDRDDLFPGVERIPASWISQPRAYHTTTCKEIIQRAIVWQAAVQIRLAGGRKAFTPINLEEEGSKWRINGQWQSDTNTTSVQADDIKEIMILLPSLE